MTENYSRVVTTKSSFIRSDKGEIITTDPFPLSEKYGTTCHSTWE